MLFVPFKYNFRNLVARKRTTAAAAVGLALVVFVFASAMMLAAGIKKAMGRAASPDVVIVLRKGSDTELSSGIEDKDVNLVIAQAEQVGASKKPAGIGEIVVVILLEKIGANGVSNVTVRGTTEDVLKLRSSVKVIEGRPPSPGTDEVMVGAAIRGRFQGLAVGQTFELKKNRNVKVVGVFSDDGSAFESEVWADRNTVAQAFGRQGYVSSVRVRLDGASKYDAFKALVEQNRQLGLITMREGAYFEKQSQATEFILNLLGGMVAFFFIIGGMIGATITMNAQVAGRTKEIGTLRALGYPRWAILLSFLLESLALSIIGGGAGALLSLVMKTQQITMLNAGTWSEIVFRFEPTMGIVLGSVILAMIMGILGGFLPAVRAARISPIIAMRG